MHSIARALRTFLNPQTLARPQRFTHQVIEDSNDKAITKNVIQMVNESVAKKTPLFAVVQVCGKQFKITENDLIVIEGNWPPMIGDQLRLEKVLLVGSQDFTLIGRPLLPLNEISVKATVIEKGLSHTRTRFFLIKRKQHRLIRFSKSQLTFLRINSITFIGKVNEHGDVDGTIDRLF